MKDLLRLFFVIFSLFFFVSCGGNENGSAQENESDSDGDGAAVALRILRDADSGCTGMQLDCITTDIAAINFQIRNGKGETVFQKSVPRNKLKDLGKELTGIKNADNATLIVAVFLGDNMNDPKWEGKATGLKFEKGKTTSATILLYPTAAQQKEIAMPERLETARFGHSATVLIDGRILISGGFTSCGSNGKCAATESVEIIDMESGKIETLAPMTAKRAMHTTVALNDGSVLFIGGVQGFSSVQQESEFKNYPLLPYSQSGAVTTIERYMPSYPKFNMKENGLGTPIANYTEAVSTPSEIPFLAFQSVLTKKISDTQTEVFLVGGLDEKDENNTPSNKTYKFTITDSTADDGSVSISEVSEFEEVTESSEESEEAVPSPMLLPALAYSSGSILAVGGRNNSSKFAASLISENKSENIGENSDNIFFANSIVSDSALYTFGGMPNKSGVLENSKNNGATRKWNLDGSMTIFDKSENILRSWNANVAFAETVHDSNNNRFIVIGGTDAEDLYQVINATDFELYGSSPTHKMTDKRIMPKASIVPAGVIGNRQILVITGGTSALNSSGSAVNTIKINLL